MIKIKSHLAHNGDAFLVMGTGEKCAMLIDGGYADTFNSHIKADLIELAAKGFELDVVVATHIDADHISGLLSFFRMNGNAANPLIIRVSEVLYNNLRSILPYGVNHGTHSSDDTELLQELRIQGLEQECSDITSAHEISARQGNSLAKLLLEGGYQWNTKDGSLSVGGDGLTELLLPKVKINILGPNSLRLLELRNWWTAEIRRLGLVGSLYGLDDVFEYLCSREQILDGSQLLSSSEVENLAEAHFPDRSVTNASSISLIVNLEGCRLLFLGDSWAEDIVSALEPGSLSVFDAIKVSHHGSASNTSPDLLTLVDSPHYFISTNGERHEHPDFAVLKAIVDRPADFCRKLHFNYSTPSSRRLIEYQKESNIDFEVDEGQADWVTIEK